MSNLSADQHHCTAGIAEIRAIFTGDNRFAIDFLANLWYVLLATSTVFLTVCAHHPIPCGVLMKAMIFFALAAMGCTGDVNSDSNDTSIVDPDDTSDTANYTSVSVTVNWSLDGVVQSEAVGVCLHKAEGDVGNEPPVATAQSTGVPIIFDAFNGGQMVRPWVGPTDSQKTSDGYRILELDGFHYIHELADFKADVETCGGGEAERIQQDGCSVTVPVNVMPALEGVDYACVGQQWWSESGKELSNSPHNFTQRFVASEGHYFADPSEMGFDELFGINMQLMTKGTELRLYNSTSRDDYALDEGTEVMQNGFTVVLDDGDIITNLTCTVK